MKRRLKSPAVALKALSTVTMLVILAYAARNYDALLRKYAEYWSLRSPIGPIDKSISNPIIILSVSRAIDGVTVKLFRTYAEPNLLELAVIARLHTRGGGFSFLAAKVRVPVGTIQELVFLGGFQEPIVCVDLTFTVGGFEVTRWSDCVRTCAEP